MSLATPELLDAISALTTIREMKIALDYSIQCGTINFLTTVFGGLAGGPIGIAAGGLLGAAISSYHAKGKFKSVPEILSTKATPEQKEKLADALRSVLKAENILTLVEFAATIQNNRLLMETIKKVVRDFLSNDMGYHCII